MKEERRRQAACAGGWVGAGVAQSSYIAPLLLDEGSQDLLPQRLAGRLGHADRQTATPVPRNAKFLSA